MNNKISQQAKETAKHIGILSEGAIQTLIDETIKKDREELLEEIKGKIKILKVLLKDFKEGKITCENNDVYISLLGQTKGKLKAFQDIKKIIQ